ncbi:MAG: energy-coupling factor transporter ATPase [Christensenellales bacterium]
MIIQADNVSYSYPTDEEEMADEALRHLSLNIERGEFVAVVGHNGSGKSTFAKMLNAILVPSEGVVVVDGIDTREEEMVWEIRRNCGMVFQNPDNQLVAGVVEEDVAFGPENLGVESSEIRRRVDEALLAVGMTEYAAKGPHMLSGGQKQRVAIAGILAMRPSIIVLDEPTAMLDPSGRQEVMQTVKRLNREDGITVVHITHYMEEALLADRVVVVNEGEAVLCGTPPEVFAKVETIRALGLDVPAMAELLYLLKQEGICLESWVFTVEEMAEELCRLL